MISYAQNFEDVMLWRALKHVPQGFYIDIGAQDPIIDSVSLAFHAQGWRGIHVEPMSHYAELLRRQRPGDVVIQAAIGESATLIPFYAIANSGISTTNFAIAERHRDHGFTIQESLVPSVPLSAVFQACDADEIHWLKLDIEGSESQAILSWGDDPRLPWIVVVESTLPLSQVESHADWEPALLDMGYRSIYFDGLNRYYLAPSHRDLATAFAAPPNVFDDFSVNGTASTSLHRLLESRHRDALRALQAELDERDRQLTETTESHASALRELDLRRVQAERDKTADETRVRSLTESLELALQSVDHHQRLILEQAKTASRWSGELVAAHSEHRAEAARWSEEASRQRDEHADELQRLRRAHDDELVERTKALHAERELQANALRISQEQLAELRAELALESVLSKRRADEVQQRLHTDLQGARGEAEMLSARLDSLTRTHDLIARERDALAAELQEALQQLGLVRTLAESQHARIGNMLSSWRWRATHPAEWLFASGRVDADAEAGGSHRRSHVPTSQGLTLPDGRSESMTSSGYHGKFVNVRSVQELLALYDSIFVVSAYQAVLGRPADPDGRANYLAQVRAGAARESIVVEMALSEEGRRAASSLDGLPELIAKSTWRSNRLRKLIGRFFAGRTTQMHMGFRRVENLVARLADANTMRLERLELQVLELNNAALDARAISEQVMQGSSLRSTALLARRASAEADADAPLHLERLTAQQRLVLGKLL